MRTLKRFLQDRSGATSIEYGLIAGLVSVVVIGAVRNVGTNVSRKFAAIGANLT